MKSVLLERIFSALPDSLTATFFLIVWLNPLWLGEDSVRHGMLIMLVEFILVHASGFLGAQVFAVDTSRASKVRALLGFGLFYLIFITAWAYTFRQWWPFVVFGWLLAGKFNRLGMSAINDEARKQRMTSDWALAAMVYLFGVFVTVIFPMPRLGIDADVVSSLDLSGSGLWVSEPHRVIAFGMIYFSLLAWLKWKQYQLPATGRPTSGTKHDADSA